MSRLKGGSVGQLMAKNISIRFLNRMLIFFAISWPTLPPFKRDILLSEVNPDETDADRIAATAFELRCLIFQVVYHTIDLLNHGFSKNFRFRTNLDRCHRAARHEHSFFNHCYGGWNQLAKCSIAASRWFASHDVL